MRTAATGPSRNLFVDVGQPTGKKKSTDKLTVFYTPPRPRIIHSTETPDPDAGLVDLDYGTARFLVQYDDIESAVIAKEGGIAHRPGGGSRPRAPSFAEK